MEKKKYQSFKRITRPAGQKSAPKSDSKKPRKKFRMNFRPDLSPEELEKTKEALQLCIEIAHKVFEPMRRLAQWELNKPTGSIEDNKYAYYLYALDLKERQEAQNILNAYKKLHFEALALVEKNMIEEEYLVYPGLNIN